MPIASKNINAEKIQGNLSITSISASAFTGSFIGDGAGLYNLPTQSFDTGSLLTTASFNAFTVSYATGSFTGSFTGSLHGTASYALTASYVLNAISSSFAETASYVEIAQTASYVLQAVSSSFSLTSSFITASNVRGPYGSNSVISASYALQALSSSYANFATSASHTLFASTASNILGGKATHVPYFITDTTLATSSIFQSGSSTVIINQDNATTANPEALYVWQPSTSSINVISGKGNLNNYLQLNIQNTNQGISASSDVVATANNGNETTNYIDMGINSENFNTGFVGNANDAYLYSTGNHLHIGNVSNFPIQIFAGGSDVDIHNKLELNPNNQHVMSGSLDVSGSIKAFSFTGSLQGNATSATTSQTSSYSTTLGASLSQPANNQVRLLNSAGGTLSTVTVDNVISASYASNSTTADYAATAGNGGVTQIIAGSGITLLPPAGTGAVTVIASAGGGVTIISGSLVTGSFVNTTSYTFSHNLNTRTPIITVFDSNYNQIIPENIQLVDTGSAIITFPTPESGFAIGSTGGTTGTALSSSYSIFSTYADTASYFVETDPVFVARSASLATTGSNVFTGNQTVTGSLIVTNGITGSLLGTSSYAVTASYALFAETASSALNAQDILIYVLNNSGYNIPKGAVVHITASGNSSDIPRIVTASYENDNNSANTLGITNESITTGALGYVMTEGVLRGIDTSNFISGQLIYLGATGSIIGSAPQAPLHTVRLGQVVRQQSNNGSVYVKINNGYEIGELHDVRDTTTTSSYGDLLVKSGSVWTNSKQLTGSYAVTGSLTVSGSGTFTNIGPAVFSGSVGISGSQTFYGTSAFYGNHTLSGSNTITGDTILSGSIEVSGSSNFRNSVFIVTGSTYFRGTHEVSGSTTITGSLNITGNVNIVSGSSFTRWGNKLFNYGQFANTASISLTQNVSASVALPLMYFNDGVSIVSGSRISFSNTGLYNIQYSALALQGNTSPSLRIWFRKTGSNVDNSSTIIQLQNNSQTAVTSQFAQSINAGEYVELWYHSNGANTSFPYTAAASGFPAAPSIIVTVTQIA